MDRSTAPARVPVDIRTPADIVDQAAHQEPEPPPRLTLSTPFPAPTQATMPIRADGQRGSDRIRFRIWQDPRLTGLVQTVLVVISEFVNQAHAARLKGRTIAECAHMSVERCLKAANTAAELGVLAIDRRSHHRRYVFLDDWLRWFGAPAETPERHDVSSSHRSERHDVSSSHDTTIRRVTGEPVQVNRSTYARPGPQAGGAAVPRSTRAKAPAGGRAVALDLQAIIERDRQQADEAHRSKTDGKIKTVLVMESSEGGDLHKTATTPDDAEKSTTVAGGKTETTPTATPQTAAEKSITAADDDDYTDEMYRADEKACFELMDQAARARGAFRCSCGCPEPGTVCPQCGARCGGD